MPAVARGQIVLVDFPYSDGKSSKIRPAVVVQSDALNATLSKTLIAMITGNLRRQTDPAHIFLDPATHPTVGVHGPSLISCVNLFTVEQTAILRVLGELVPELDDQLDLALKHALSL